MDPITGVYGDDIVALRVRQLQDRAQGAMDQGPITPAQFDRVTQDLSGISRDERERAYQTGGNIASQDFQAFHQRLDDVERVLDVLLAE
jgi:hypothetical protein